MYDKYTTATRKPLTPVVLSQWCQVSRLMQDPCNPGVDRRAKQKKEEEDPVEYEEELAVLHRATATGQAKETCACSTGSRMPPGPQSSHTVVLQEMSWMTGKVNPPAQEVW